MKTIDLMKIAKIINPDKTRLAYEENKHFFTKIAFDVFQMNNSPVESYWILEKDDDGKEYLVSQYEDSSSESIEVTSNWEALSDKEAKNVTLSYKDVPFKRFASSEYGFDKSDVHIFTNALTQRLSSDKEFLNKLIKILPEKKRDSLTNLFPELVE